MPILLTGVCLAVAGLVPRLFIYEIERKETAFASKRNVVTRIIALVASAAGAAAIIFSFEAMGHKNYLVLRMLWFLKDLGLCAMPMAAMMIGYIAK